MTPGAWGAIATIAIFAITLIFGAGYLTAEFRGIQIWKTEVRSELLLLMRAVRRIERQLGIEEP